MKALIIVTISVAKRKVALYSAFAFLLLFSSCIQENPDLVNPPLVVETVKLRFFNLAQDEEARTLWFDTKAMSTNLAFNSVSNADNPPFDSVAIEVFKDDNTKTYSSLQKFKFGRLSNYVMLSVPNLRRRTELDTGFFNTDTIIYLQSTTLKPDDTNQCYVKFLNANPDTSANYSIKIGCPNGENLFIDNQITNVNFMQGTGTQTVYEGKRAISVLKNTKITASPGEETTTQSEVIGIFELELTHLQQYALIVNKLDEVYFFNELDINLPPVKLENVPERTANVRVVNLTSKPVTVSSEAAGDLVAGLPADNLSQYKTITTCDVMNLDKIYLQAGGAPSDTAFMSFDIYKDYTLVAFEQAEQGGAQLVGIPPIDDRMSPKPGMAIVRVLNTNYANSGITVSTGAAAADNSQGIMSGQTLAVNLMQGECSAPVYLPVNAGDVPIAAFASTQPTKYILSAMANLESEKEYILTIDNLNEGKIGVIELTQQQQVATFALPATFVQMANVMDAQANIALLAEGNKEIISTGKIDAGEILTTFLPKGNSSLKVNSTNASLNFSTGALQDRTLLVAAGTAGSPELFAITGKTMGADNTNLKWRFINATSDVQTMDVYQIDRQDTIQQNLDVQYKTASGINTYYRDKKYSFIFRNKATNEEMYLASDLLMTIAKNYTIILWGDARSGYRILIVQEY